MGIIDSEIIPSKVFTVSSYSISMSTTKYLTLKKAVNGTLFGLALLMAAARLVIRFHSQRKLHPDDFVLMFACLTFIASQVLLYILHIDNIHRFGAATFEPSPQTPVLTIEDPEAYYRGLSKIMRMEYSIGILTWTSIFAVKICFLLFFHQMITRLQRLIVAWRVMLGITVISWALCSCGFFISCPHFGRAALRCTEGRGFARNLAVDFMGFVLDTVSDLLLISLPLMLLWKAKIKRRQKIFLSVFLCLSVCMIIIASIRVLAFNINGTYNAVWGLFWHQAEAAIAIIMVSITAFRSLLGLKAVKARKKKEMERYWFAHRPKLRARYFKKATADKSESEQLPPIPGAVLTGMRTFINGNGIWDKSVAMGVTHQSEKDTPGAASHKPREFEITHQISTESNIFDGAEHTRVANFV